MIKTKTEQDGYALRNELETIKDRQSHNGETCPKCAGHGCGRGEQDCGGISELAHEAARKRVKDFERIVAILDDLLPHEYEKCGRREKPTKDASTCTYIAGHTGHCSFVPVRRTMEPERRECPNCGEYHGSSHCYNHPG